MQETGKEPTELRYKKNAAPPISAQEGVAATGGFLSPPPWPENGPIPDSAPRPVQKAEKQTTELRYKKNASPPISAQERESAA